MSENSQGGKPTHHIHTANPTIRTPIVPGLGVPKVAVPVKAIEDEPIELVEEIDAGNQIRALGSAGYARRAADFQRQTTVSGHGACRMRTFHGRLSDEGLAFLDEKVNDWLDRHPEIEVKFVTSTVGVIEGKIKEASLVLVVWY